MLVQITERRGKTRGPASEADPPDNGFIEIGEIGPHQRVVHVKWRRGIQWRRRKTVDWYWVVTIETRL